MPVRIPGQGDGEVSTGPVVQASDDTRSWLQILTGQPGVVTVQIDGRETRVAIDESRNARIVG